MWKNFKAESSFLGRKQTTLAELESRWNKTTNSCSLEVKLFWVKTYLPLESLRWLYIYAKKRTITHTHEYTHEYTNSGGRAEEEGEPTSELPQTKLNDKGLESNTSCSLCVIKHRRTQSVFCLSQGVIEDPTSHLGLNRPFRLFMIPSTGALEVFGL